MSFYDDGQEIVNIGTVTDIALAMSEDPSWDSFAARTLMVDRRHYGEDDKVVMRCCKFAVDNTLPLQALSIHLAHIMADYLIGIRPRH